MTPQDVFGLQTIEDNLRHHLDILVSQLVYDRDKRVESLLRVIREIDEECSKDIDFLLKGQYNLGKILKEIRDKELVPLVSEDPLTSLIGQLIANKDFDRVDRLTEQISPQGRLEKKTLIRIHTLRREELRMESQSTIQIKPLRKEELGIELQTVIYLSPLRRKELRMEFQTAITLSPLGRKELGIEFQTAITISQSKIEDTSPMSMFSLQNEYVGHCLLFTSPSPRDS